MSASRPWGGLPAHQRSRLFLRRSTKCEALTWTLFQNNGEVEDRESETLMGRVLTKELPALGVRFERIGSEKSLVGIVTHDYALTFPDTRSLDIVLAAHFNEPISQVLQ